MSLLTIEAMGEMLAAMQLKQKDERKVENEELKLILTDKIKREVSEQIAIELQPIETRQTKLEKEVEELLKTIVSTLQDNNSKPVSQIGTNMNSQPKSTQAVISNNDFLRLPNYQMPPSEIKDLIKSAKYCLTFSPITAETLKTVTQR